MKTLLESSHLLDEKDSKPLDMTTKLITPKEEDSENEEQMISRIPKKYHIVRTFPIFPKDYADQGYRVYNNNGAWNVVLWPSVNPDTRQDVQYLSDAVRLMLDELQGDQYARVDATQMQDVQKAKANASHLIQVFEKRCSLLRLALDELTRQVSAHCTERGSLLSFLIADLFNAFQEIPKQYNSALKVFKREVDQLRVTLDAKCMEMESQNKDLNEQISLMQLERKLEKEWHEQLEGQVQKWKVQVESFKKKAQEQIKLEREMLEHQIEGLREIVSDLRMENDALKEQLRFQRNEMLKSEKKYAEYEQQILNLNKKNEKLQLQLSKGCGIQAKYTERLGPDGKPPEPGPEKDLSSDSKLKYLLLEYPKRKEFPLLSQKEITQAVFTLLDHMFNNPQSFAPFDDFYAMRIIVSEESPQTAADKARAFLISLKENEGTFTLAQLANDLFHRRYNNAIFKILIQFYGFFRAQPFQYVSQVDQNTDVPLVPVDLAASLLSTMFSSLLGDDGINEVVEDIKMIQIEERGKQPMIQIATVFDLIMRKINDYFNQKSTETLNNFQRHYARYQKTINSRTVSTDASIQRMDWRTFRDFMKPVRPELTSNEVEKIFFQCTQFSDSVASVTSDAFDTMCVIYQIYVNNIKVPGSGKRLRFVPNEMLAVIDSAWKNSLRSSVKKAITELSKSEQSQGVVITLRGLDQRLDDTLKNPNAGPFCMQLLHEAASLIGSEAMTIAASLPVEKCLAIMEKQITVLNTETPK